MPSKPRILLIDDDVDFLTVLTYLVEAMGYELSTATCAEMALRDLTKSRADLILCDLTLKGGMSGFDFAQKAQALFHPVQTPLIAVTGYKDAVTIQKAYTAGFNEVFTKPVKFNEIKSAVERYATVR